MGSFWPKGIDIKDVAAPYEILQLANQDWLTESEGLLSLVIQEKEPEEGMEEFIVHALHIPSDRSVTLFSVTQLGDTPYPARITLRGDRIPIFLQKEYHRTKKGILADANALYESKELIANKWVSETPADFRKHLSEALNSSETKSVVFSLLASIKGTDDSDEDETAS